MKTGALHIERELELQVDYTQTLAEMVAAGNYQQVDPRLTAELFPITPGNREITAVLVRFGDDGWRGGVNGDEAVELMAAAGLRPATLPELLALGAQFPELQYEHIIVALGSFWRSPAHVRYVGWLFHHRAHPSHAENRKLSLSANESNAVHQDWASYCRFLAVRVSGE